jgi:DNA-binding NarL/FixJ family response regulator
MSHHREVSQHELPDRDALDEHEDEEIEPMITVLLVNDEAIVREGLRMRLALEADMKIVGESTTGAEALEQVQRLQPAIVLMDLALPDMDGIAAIAALRAACPASAVVILSLHDDATIRARAQAAGAAAFVGTHEGVKTVLTVIRHVGQRGRQG